MDLETKYCLLPTTILSPPPGSEISKGEYQMRKITPDGFDLLIPHTVKGC